MPFATLLIPIKIRVDDLFYFILTQCMNDFWQAESESNCVKIVLPALIKIKDGLCQFVAAAVKG